MTKGWGKELRRLREEKKWTQEKLIDELISVAGNKYKGYEAPWISKLEHGHITPPRELVIDLGEVFDLPTAEKISFILKATDIPEEMREEIVGLYRQGFGAKVQEQLTELAHQVESEHFEQARILMELLERISQQMAEQKAVSTEEEQHKQQVKALVQKFKNQLIFPRSWEKLNPLPSLMDEPNEVYTMRMYPDNPLGQITGPTVYECKRLANSDLLVHCPVEIDHSFDCVKEYFNDPKIWSKYQDWMKLAGDILEEWEKEEMYSETRQFILSGPLGRFIRQNAPSELERKRVKLDALANSIMRKLDQMISEVELV
jgi:transcriptional regulator with XRE-family HTH domain